VHLVTRGHSGSRDKDGGHTNRSAMSEYLMLHANFMALGFTESKLLPIEVLYCGNDILDVYAPVTLTQYLYIRT